MDWLYYERELWRSGFCHVAGVDEAGRGPLAGPVVAAAVVFRPDAPPIDGINDSKQLSASRREELFKTIIASATSIGVGSASPEEIDRFNILQATYLAMARAIALLIPPPDQLLIDGRGMPRSGVPGRALVKGDCLSMSIAAASIIAKVTRDQIMVNYDALHPAYGFAGHKGYPTEGHIKAIRQHGLCPIHRRSFHPRALNEIPGPQAADASPV